MTENKTNEIISNTSDTSTDLNDPEWKSQKDRVRELTDKLEAGVQSVFESENYKQYLKCMSKFHRYSINNSLLIAMQCPNATLVAGYQAWEKNHGRHVRKGEKGIRKNSRIHSRGSAQRLMR